MKLWPIYIKMTIPNYFLTLFNLVMVLRRSDARVAVNWSLIGQITTKISFFSDLHKITILDHFLTLITMKEVSGQFDIHLTRYSC